MLGRQQIPTAPPWHAKIRASQKVTRLSPNPLLLKTANTLQIG
jgi:hypothetical protein